MVAATTSLGHATALGTPILDGNGCRHLELQVNGRTPLARRQLMSG